MDNTTQPRSEGSYDRDRWAAFWLRIAGAALLVGFFAPAFTFIEQIENPPLGERRATVASSWSWSHLDHLDPWGQVGVFLPLVLGVLWLVLSAASAVSRRRRWLLVGSIAILFLQTVPGAARPLPMVGQWGEGILEALRYQSVNIALLLAAVGCHLRWEHPDLAVGRKLAGVGGVLVVMCWPFLQDGWRLVRDFAVTDHFGYPLHVLLLVAYGTCAATAALPGGRGRARICRWMARGYLVAAVPLSAALYLQFDPGFGDGVIIGVGRALLSSLHSNGWLIGIGLTLALTLAVWLEPKAR